MAAWLHSWPLLYCAKYFMSRAMFEAPTSVAQVLDLEVRWPNGDKETVSKVAADRLVVIREGVEVVQTEKFPRRD
jgi:hypothetical protein